MRLLLLLYSGTHFAFSKSEFHLNDKAVGSQIFPLCGVEHNIISVHKERFSLSIPLHPPNKLEVYETNSDMCFRNVSILSEGGGAVMLKC